MSRGTDLNKHKHTQKVRGCFGRVANKIGTLRKRGPTPLQCNARSLAASNVGSHAVQTVTLPYGTAVLGKQYRPGRLNQGLLKRCLLARFACYVHFLKRPPRKDFLAGCSSALAAAGAAGAGAGAAAAGAAGAGAAAAGAAGAAGASPASLPKLHQGDRQPACQ